MESKAQSTHYLGAAALLLVVAGLMSAVVDTSASLANIRGVAFWPLFLIYSILSVPAGVRRLGEALAAGPGGRATMVSIRQRYLEAITLHPELRAWPESTLTCILAAASILVKASFRAWIILLLSIALSRLLGSEVKSELHILWALFTCIEVFLIGIRSYNRGTLPLAGMGAAEMEMYIRERIDKTQDGYLSPGQ